ncbi:tRNA (guanine(46)-N(7))-methyltransferase TrmB [Mucisphaera sp.]|uniref:tRNA (guanine(46)-N(7))-methyltransferase TrmB n=1 Tax=Mucisphaera sp. TaxID=2913024 RepID=UPI003D0DA0A4
MPQSVHQVSRLDPGSWGIDAEQLPAIDDGPIHPQTWFQTPDQPAQTPDSTPIELEIGSGKGTFLVQQALAEPSVRYVGLEYARAFYRYAADRLRRRNLPNARAVHAEAAVFIQFLMPTAVFRQVHLYFPDPWPKKRHHKRRFFCLQNLQQVHRILVDPHPDDPESGQFRIATDHADYFAWMEDHASQAQHLFDRLPYRPPASAGEAEVVGSNFERKYRDEGRSFHGMILRKRPQ